MKFYTYLVCMSNIAQYPEHTRMFRQKDLSLTKIKQAIGITDKTAKQYLYELEEAGLVIYKGEIQHYSIVSELHEEIAKAKTEKQRYYIIGAALWRERNKHEKQGVYLIPRPDLWTPVPQETLEALNVLYQCSELELKMYLLCTSYWDLCNYKGKKTQNITFEMVREALQIKKTGSTPNRDIQRALMFLKILGLVDYVEGFYSNNRGAKIPCFRIVDVGEYVQYNIENIKDDLISEEDFEQLKQRLFSL